MKFLLDGRAYEAAAVDRLTLADLIRLESETADMGRPMKWSELRGIIEHFDEVLAVDEDYDIEGDDLFPWFLGILVWASRRAAGDSITFGQAVDIELGQIEVLPDKKQQKVPADHKQKAGGKADPRRARPASGRAAKRPARATASPANP